MVIHCRFLVLDADNALREQAVGRVDDELKTLSQSYQDRVQFLSALKRKKTCVLVCCAKASLFVCLVDAHDVMLNDLQCELRNL